MHFTPLLLSLIVGLLLSLLAWSASVRYRPGAIARPAHTSDGMLMGLVVLAAFALGAFVTYVLLAQGL